METKLEPITLGILQDLLDLVMEDPPSLEKLSTLSQEQWETIGEWCGQIHCEASDNDIDVGGPPKCLRDLLPEDNFYKRWRLERKPMKQFHAVIHVRDQEQALSEVAVAVEAGVDGVWLINHQISSVSLRSIFSLVRKVNPDLWMGLNFLDLNNHEALATIIQMDEHVDGLWCDKGGIGDGGRVPTKAINFWDQKKNNEWNELYFGGVAFKGQVEVAPQDVARVARLASEYMDVVTTSGTRTGEAAPVEKIKTMKEALGFCPLAVASGITPENVLDYLPYVDYFMVASGISKDFTHLDPERTKKLAELIHQGPT